MTDTEKQVEAVLFAVGKEITTERIASLCSLQATAVEAILQQLTASYADRDQALQIIKKENGWKLTVRDAFVPLVSKLVSSTEVERPLMETLAVIAWKYPVLQADIVKLRGSSAYEHMRQLEEQGLVAKEKFGRTFKIHLTQKFFEYFDLPSAEAKQAFLKQVPPAVIAEAEQVEKEADEVERLIEIQGQEKESRAEIKKATGSVKNSDGSFK